MIYHKKSVPDFRNAFFMAIFLKWPEGINKIKVRKQLLPKVILKEALDEIQSSVVVVIGW